MAGAQRERQNLRDEVEGQRREDGGLLGFATRVLVEGSVVVLNTGIFDAAPGESADIREAAGIARRSRRAVRRARRNALVHPGGPVEEFVVFVVRADDAAQTPVVRRAQANLVLHVFIALGRPPGRAGRKALRREGRIAAAARAVALIVVGIRPTRIVRIVADLADVPNEVPAGVARLQVAELAVHRPRSVLESI